MVNPERKQRDARELIWVCSECLCACCWAGIFMCQRSKHAGLKKITKREARRLGYEHEDYIQRLECQAGFRLSTRGVEIPIRGTA